jgi:3-hydroxyisobutyrate dehydrogenase-like beta-hydroxyacid dehydrogenase
MTAAQHRRVGVLHPGAMGAAIAHALKANDHDAAWCRAGRSPATAHRASGLREFQTLLDLAQWADTIISVVPPHAAIATARDTAGVGFRGLYVDANAISPATAATVRATVEQSGATYIDGGIIGPPPTGDQTSRLYLAGDRAPDVAALFKNSAFEAPILGTGPYAASALKMVYAAWTKGSAAMLLATAHAADSLGVLDALKEEWQHSAPDVAARHERTEKAVAPKAWRYVGEMLEIASTLESVGQPAGFHQAATKVYQHIADNNPTGNPTA